MKSSQRIKTLLLVSFCTVIFFSAQAQNLEKEIDAIVSSMYSAEEPGISILVAKEGKSIYRKAFGKANLELDVSLKPENVFEIGSITKQFTAVAILMLEEQGKLTIDDEITKYIPDYPTNDKKITIHHLLNHTSGIKSYTGMASFMESARTDMTPTELIDVFKNEPMDFDPGEEFRYNNSGYILLGHIIEVITKDTYENYIEKNIFEKIGMNSSYYGSMSELIKNRASGYKQDGDKFLNADYLSLTLPYAAGSLMSTVDDLLKWQNAISANTFIKRTSLEKAINGSKLNNGEEINYGYGWGKTNIQGAKGYAHSGGIFGYTTNGIFLEKENVYVIGLTNCNCKNVGEVTMKVAATVIGKPIPDKKDAIELSIDEAKKWVGAYEFKDNVIRHIMLKDGKLFSLREGENSREFEIYQMKDGSFIFDDGTISYNFSKTADGKRQTIFKTANESFTGKGVDKAPPAERKSITVSSDILKQYVGKYELQPNFIIEITLEGNSIFAKATGQPKFELFAETETLFYLKVVPAEITFNTNDKGVIDSLILNQGGRKMPAKRIE
ncbi:CubicO group peptidase, beta-lactamase class C family [Aquimarina amphilecti]|uniref:CubicO group peptidase, beta-lactamase class C family n=1 Tax=Aquimarina amphilecti TaxID=1038014 RepID=A0A1H7GHA4_AQUAM|nr:serine hydrolase [Aquimarina amphilecti]SEK36312.1 CubicO group peptidase, beta-lactamase class C family [Aquimarina amphilecti]